MEGGMDIFFFQIHTSEFSIIELKNGIFVQSNYSAKGEEADMALRHWLVWLGTTKRRTVQ